MENDNTSLIQKRAIVAGATGFIGANLTRKLLDRGYQVGVLLREESYSFSLDDISDHIEFLHVDYQQQTKLNETFENFNCTHIFNCAQPGFKLYEKHEQFSLMLSEGIQVMMSLLLAAAKLKGLQSMVHCCSSTIYDWSEDAYLLSEETKVNPTTLRGIAKATERNLCKFYASKQDLPVRLARVFRAYGPWDKDQKLILKALDAIYKNHEISLTNSAYKRDYVYVGDLVNGLIDLAEAHVEHGVEINFGGGAEFSAEDMVTELEKLTGLKAKISSDSYPKNTYDKGRYLASIEKAKQILNWMPSTNIEEGLAETIKWYKKYKM
jgi:nucleoside-diphosphate-sugar epimerase